MFRLFTPHRKCGNSAAFDPAKNQEAPVMATSTSRSEIVRALAERIQEIESTLHRQEQRALSLGIPALESLLPQKRLPGGSLMELLSAAEGTGAWTLALVMAKRACEQGKALIVADSQRCFYPPAAARLGIDLDRLIVLRPTKPRDLYAGVEQSLRCAAVGAVVAWFDRLPSVDGRRLQLAAETGGGIGFFLRSRAALRAPSFAALRLLITPAKPAAGLRRVVIEVVRCRGGKPGSWVALEIDDETGHVHVLPEMAVATPVPRSARASG
jgi:protein ImuA